MKTNVKLDRTDKIGYISFFSEKIDKPPTLDIDVLDKFDKLISNINSNIEQYRMVVVQSDTSKYFVIGANLNALKKLDKYSIIQWVKKGHKVFNNLSALPIPTVAKINGYALGGGLELALACDMIIATKNSYFGQPETGLGFVPGWGGSIRLQRRIGISRAKEMFFTAEIIDADTAYKMRLCDFVGNYEDVDNYLTNLIRKISNNSSLAVSMVKKLIENGQSNNSIYTDYYNEALASSICIDSEDTKKRLKDFFRKKTNE